jgi:hypothetical protein
MKQSNATGGLGRFFWHSGLPVRAFILALRDGWLYVPRCGHSAIGLSGVVTDAFARGLSLTASPCPAARLPHRLGWDSYRCCRRVFGSLHSL